MAVTGWFVLLVAAGAVPLVAVGEPWVLLAWLALCALLGGLDVLLAASPRTVRVERDAPARLRLGESADALLRLENRGRRTLHGIVRDGWPPSAQARPGRVRVAVPPGERRTVVTRLTPFRRGARHAADVTVRSIGPLRLAARQATLRVPATVLV
ncbi:MAG: DUF58 domain-containing protein, partial [Microbacteriaceae bacterium]|nr:DUF58 domain-containing protein [Microbacteriaceae bacterium]